MTTGRFPAISALVPHQGPMCLISEVTDEIENGITVAAPIAPGHPFWVVGRGVPAYVGLELMAQTVCAFDGLGRWRRALPPAIGFLLGCRRYRSQVDWFGAEVVSVRAVRLLDGEGLGSFDCTLSDTTGEQKAAGTLNVFRPADPQQWLRERSR